jgi:DNA mismatch repair protein MutS
LTDRAALRSASIWSVAGDDALLREDLRRTCAPARCGARAGPRGGGRGSPRDLGQLRDGLAGAALWRASGACGGSPAMLDALLPHWSGMTAD